MLWLRGWVTLSSFGSCGPYLRVVRCREDRLTRSAWGSFLGSAVDLVQGPGPCRVYTRLAGVGLGQWDKEGSGTLCNLSDQCGHAVGESNPTSHIVPLALSHSHRFCHHRSMYEISDRAGDDATNVCKSLSICDGGQGRNIPVHLRSHRLGHPEHH